MNGMGKGIGIALLAALLAAGCERSHARSSSGSNWLACEKLADCGAEQDAVACDAAGYCVDAEGERFPVAADAGPSSEPRPPEPDGSGPCPWGVDELLGEVGVEVPNRVNCGSYGLGVSPASEVDAGMQCFVDAILEQAVQLTVNRCFDCSVPTTYVATPSQQLYAILMAQDFFSEARQREVRVERCESLDLDPETPEVTCRNPVELFACREPLGDPREPPPPPPLQPLKLSDVPVPDGAASALLHLYISNQSSETPLVDVDVYIDETLVVRGDFDVGGQHNWILFDLTVPAGELRVEAMSQRGVAELDERIDVSAERWAVLDYWYYRDDSLGRYFDLAVHDQPVTFE